MSDERLLVGRVRGPHGIRGAVKIEVITDRPEARFSEGGRLFAEQTPLTISNASRTKNGYLLTFDEIVDRTGAEGLKGKELAVDRSDAQTAPGEFLHNDLIGLSVVTTAGEEIGEVVDIFNTGANDIYEVKGKKDVLIPAIEEVIEEINLEAKRITIHPIEGLLE